MTQSVISAYETGSRQPSLAMLDKLVQATGCELNLEIRVPRPRLGKLRGPLGRRVRRHRDELVAAAARHGATNLRVFGSVARGEETADSDVDLLVDLPAGIGLFGLARLEEELEEILAARVDLIPGDGLKSGLRRNVGSDLVVL